MIMHLAYLTYNTLCKFLLTTFLVTFLVISFLLQAVRKHKSSKPAGGMGDLGYEVIIYFWTFPIMLTRISS